MAHEINKLQLQILEARHIETKTKNKKIELIELTLKIATMFWNALSPFFFLKIFYFSW